MGAESVRRKNHYVSRGYLKRWALSSGRLWVYRILVSHPNVPLWKQGSPRGVAYHSHLYTRIVTGKETDEVERWLDQEFEAPAQEALDKAVSDARMTPEDWTRLIRFVAAQDVRTPARLEEQMRYWRRTGPALLDDTLQKSVQELEKALRSKGILSKRRFSEDYGLPVRVFRKDDPKRGSGIVVEIAVGRSLWLWGIRRLLQHTVKVLLKHRWTVLHAPEGLSWFTSDNPVLRLNFSSPTRYDFDGGWGSKGTEIIVPLSPTHLLYTQIGKRPPIRGTRMPKDEARWVRRFIAEHAYRQVIAHEPDHEVAELRPRLVDADMYRRERQQWDGWHQDQSKLETELIDKRGDLAWHAPSRRIER